jgi:hypothetical protein
MNLPQPDAATPDRPCDLVVYAATWQGALEDDYHPEPEPFEPSPEDWLDYELYLERLDVENQCNARFV